MSRGSSTTHRIVASRRSSVHSSQASPSAMLKQRWQKRDPILGLDDGVGQPDGVGLRSASAGGTRSAAPTWDPPRGVDRAHRSAPGPVPRRRWPRSDQPPPRRSPSGPIASRWRSAKRALDVVEGGEHEVLEHRRRRRDRPPRARSPRRGSGPLPVARMRTTPPPATPSTSSSAAAAWAAIICCACSSRPPRAPPPRLSRSGRPGSETSSGVVVGGVGHDWQRTAWSPDLTSLRRARPRGTPRRVARRRWPPSARPRASWTSTISSSSTGSRPGGFGALALAGAGPPASSSVTSRRGTGRPKWAESAASTSGRFFSQ